MGANRNVGEIEFTLGEKTYIARFGNRELARLEKALGVIGLKAIYETGVDGSVANFVTFVRVGLSRHQETLTDDDVADLLDYRDENENRPVADAVLKAFWAIVPKAQTGTTKTTTETPQA